MTALAFCMTKLVVADLEAQLRFYAGIFGLKEVHRVASDQHRFALDEVILSLSGKSEGHVLALARYRRAPCPPAGSAWTGFVVRDIAATLDAVERGGGRIEVPVHRNPEHAVLAAIVTDPEGHLIEVIEMLAAP